MESLSYTEATGGKTCNRKTQDNQQRNQEKQKEWTGLTYESSEEDISWAKKG
ncbi:hypothetical protein A2U01_0106550, partial [Trifolium medium]|nr:hypothetical protein [Trifolium medium]